MSPDMPAAETARVIDLAYRSGLAHGHAYDVAELLAAWAEHPFTPLTREQRIAAEILAAGPIRFHGGLPKPHEYYPPEPSRVRPPFPTLAQQSAWLTAEDVDFCRRYAREHR